jgi:hypothetical protein
MPGLMVFHSLAAAIRAGFSVYDRTENGFIVRRKTLVGYAMALVDVTIS